MREGDATCYEVKGFVACCALKSFIWRQSITNETKVAIASEKGMAYHTPSTLFSINVGIIKIAGSKKSIWRVSDKKMLLPA